MLSYVFWLLKAVARLFRTLEGYDKAVSLEVGLGKGRSNYDARWRWTLRFHLVLSSKEWLKRLIVLLDSGEKFVVQSRSSPLLIA